MEHLPRSVEHLVEEQARRWQLRRREEGRAATAPVVAISRQHGAGGSELARRLARELGFDLFDRELIHEIAESAHLSERVVSALDEKDRELLTDWLAALANETYLSPASYREHLTRVLGAIACHGGAVILGRAAHLVLGPRRALRVMVVAPLAERVHEVARRDQLSERDAQRRIAEVEAERRAFLMKVFHADFGDLTSFDLVVNTGVLGVEGGVSAVKASLLAMPRREAAVGVRAL